MRISDWSSDVCSSDLAQLLAHGRWAGEMWQRRKDGEEFLGQIEISEVTEREHGRSHFVAVLSDITDTKRFEQELRYLANYDNLTGLANRALLSERLAHAIVRARRQDSRVAILFLDLIGRAPCRERGCQYV